MSILNVFREDDVCDVCGESPVEFVISDSNIKFCSFCFTKQNSNLREMPDVSNIVQEQSIDER
jgi:hypothetical protein